MNSTSANVQRNAVRQAATLKEVCHGAITIVGARVDPTPGHRSSTALGPNALRQALDDVLDVYRSSASGTIEDSGSGAAFTLQPETAIIDLGDLVSPCNVDALRSVCQLIDSPGALPVVLGGARELANLCVDAIAELNRDVSVVHVSPKILAGDRGQGVKTCFVGTNGLVPQNLWDEAKDADASIICAEQVHEIGIETAVQSLQAFLDAQVSVLWHIDAAVVDSGHAAGTPDLNIGGLSPEQLLAVLDGVKSKTRPAGCVVTNVAPSFDKRGLSEFVAAEALVRVLAPRLVTPVT